MQLDNMRNIMKNRKGLLSNTSKRLTEEEDAEDDLEIRVQNSES